MSEVRVLVHHQAERREDIRRAYHEVSASLADVPGLLGNELLESVAGRPGFVVLSRWRDLPSFQAWERGAAHRPSTAALRPYRDTELPIPFAVYEVTASY
ncbi:antibiotic biosynthesis monooxygenase family protein [Streptomyces sp. NPDC087425]|uniref:antibiotic biosynthesis monooxygenase family protein n=1 Tax=Streptomyces sp. NPDC087425 TaxID=3365787 RepID=UPI00380C7BA1